MLPSTLCIKVGGQRGVVENSEMAVHDSRDTGSPAVPALLNLADLCLVQGNHCVRAVPFDSVSLHVQQLIGSRRAK